MSSKFTAKNGRKKYSHRSQLLLPPADGWSKNAPAVVSFRCQGIEAMLQGALTMADRVGNPAVAAAAQRFLTESLAALAVGAKEDTAGEGKHHLTEYSPMC